MAVFLHCLIEGLGITLGYHRRIADRSFLTPKRISKTIFCLILTDENFYMLVAETVGEGFQRGSCFGDRSGSEDRGLTASS